jgi:RimJ/RimL family protein N-acetyltransferase
MRGPLGRMKKIGFSTVGILEKAWTMPNGEQIDMLMMELPKDDWLGAKGFVLI